MIRAALLLAALLIGFPAAAQEAQDSLAGGPDAWTVAGLTRGSRLNLRAEPAAAGPIVARLGNGEMLRNRGCRMVGEDRWCRVERAAGSAAGWVLARYLREAAATTPRAPEPEPVFDATGKIPCAMVPGQPTRDCAFGVARRAAGAASIRVTGTGGAARWIYFDDGAPVRSDGGGAFIVERLADLFLIRVGNERYEVPLAVVTGG
jgi:uncharacterized protein YraI